MAESLTIEVAFATPEKQVVRHLDVPDGTTVRQAVALAALEQDFPGFDPEGMAIGIWGKVVPEDRLVTTGDRVELYRPLTLSPQEIRRRRARDQAC